MLLERHFTLVDFFFSESILSHSAPSNPFNLLGEKKKKKTILFPHFSVTKGYGNNVNIRHLGLLP